MLDMIVLSDVVEMFLLILIFYSCWFLICSLMQVVVCVLLLVLRVCLMQLQMVMLNFWLCSILMKVVIGLLLLFDIEIFWLLLCSMMLSMMLLDMLFLVWVVSSLKWFYFVVVFVVGRYLLLKIDQICLFVILLFLVLVFVCMILENLIWSLCGRLIVWLDFSRYVIFFLFDCELMWMIVLYEWLRFFGLIGRYGMVYLMLLIVMF